MLGAFMGDVKRNKSFLCWILGRDLGRDVGIYLHELLAPVVKFSDVESILSINVRDIFPVNESTEISENNYNGTKNENGYGDKDYLALLRSNLDDDDNDQMQDFAFPPSNDTIDMKDNFSISDKDDDRATMSASTSPNSDSMSSINATFKDDIEEQQACKLVMPIHLEKVEIECSRMIQYTYVICEITMQRFDKF
uniref:Uncharacterized protein n=1 Tax=Romanomermis culicivorax TaxID=13658 RepID=A0A915K9I6_ROMCU